MFFTLALQNVGEVCTVFSMTRSAIAGVIALSGPTSETNMEKAKTAIDFIAVITGSFKRIQRREPVNLRFLLLLLILFLILL